MEDHRRVKAQGIGRTGLLGRLNACVVGDMRCGATICGLAEADNACIARSWKGGDESNGVALQGICAHEGQRAA